MAYIKKRKDIYHIIAQVWMDDYMDDYIAGIINIYQKIKSSIANEITKVGLLKYFWDLIGIVEQIEVDSIFRIFLRIM